MENKEPEFDIAHIEQLNQKAIQNQFFVPDSSYIEIGLFKDISLGAIYADLIFIKEDQKSFEFLQDTLTKCIKEFQNRKFDTIEPFLNETGYTDEAVDKLLSNQAIHDQIFILSPNTTFIRFLIKHIIRNQNNSRPANKFNKKKLDDNHFTLESVPVSFVINTYPLSLSQNLLTKVAEQLGEDFGVNITFMNKDPSLFDNSDWSSWMKNIECFYLDSLGRFTQSSICMEKQGALEMVGTYFFSRKRFERDKLQLINEIDFDQQIQWITSCQGVLCDFEWIQYKDLSLSPEPDDVPMMDDDQTNKQSEST